MSKTTIETRIILTIFGAAIGFFFGGSIGIASGGGATNGAFALSVIGAIIGFLAGPDVVNIMSRFKR